MKLLKLVPDNTNIGFVKLRPWAFALTALLTVLAVGATFYKGLNLGVDFVGGLMIEAKFETPPQTDRVRSVIDRLGVGDGSLQQFGDPKTVQIRLPLPEQGGAGAANAIVEKARKAMTAEFPGVTFSRYDTVSGKVSGELIQNGVLAVMLAVIGIAIFSWFRYEWQFGVSTFVARSEEHTSELQSLMRISYAVFCLKKKNQHIIIRLRHTHIRIYISIRTIK